MMENMDFKGISNKIEFILLSISEFKEKFKCHFKHQGQV